MSRFILPFLICLINTSVLSAQDICAHPACGTPLDSLNSVTAYSNACSGSIGCQDGIYKWECVELVHRYYLSRFNISLPSIPNADQTISILQNDPRFEVHIQSDLSPPRGDDIIVFGDNAKTPIGHVAIAKSDPIPEGCATLPCGPPEHYEIPIIEQNSYLNHFLQLEGDVLTGFRITGRIDLQGTAPVIGWARLRTNGYSTFGPGQSFNPMESFIIGSFISFPPTSPAQIKLGETFVLTQPLKLSTIQVAVSYSGGPNQLTVYVAGGDREPGPPLETFQFMNVPANATILTGTSVLHPQLAANTIYWIVVTAPDLVHSDFGWQFSTLEIPIAQAASQANGPWQVSPGVGPAAFAITGTP